MTEFMGQDYSTISFIANRTAEVKKHQE